PIARPRAGIVGSCAEDRCAKRRPRSVRDGGITAAKGWCPRSFQSREEARMTAQWIATALGAAAELGRSGAPMSNVEFFLRAALLIFVIVAVSTAAIRLSRRS